MYYVILGVGLLLHMKHKTAIERFTDKIIYENDCWRWTAYINPDGYGKFGDRSGHAVLSHRWSFEYYRYSIPANMQLDHLCRNRWCVNPEHLEVVTKQTNFLRGVHKFGKHQSDKTHCKAGHEYDEVNTRFGIRKGPNSKIWHYRTCRMCTKLNTQRYRNSSKVVS